jgi:hypothetical protein
MNVASDVGRAMSVSVKNGGYWKERTSACMAESGEF